MSFSCFIFRKKKRIAAGNRICRLDSTQLIATFVRLFSHGFEAFFSTPIHVSSWFSQGIASIKFMTQCWNVRTCSSARCAKKLCKFKSFVTFFFSILVNEAGISLLIIVLVVLPLVDFLRCCLKDVFAMLKCRNMLECRSSTFH